MMPLLSIDDLRRAGRDLTPPFRLALGAVTLPQPMEIQTVHRLLPGKRLTARAHWCGRSVLVKLFFDRAGYRRHWNREARGLSALLAAGIPTPRILAQAENRTDRAAALLTKYLADARTLADLPEESSGARTAAMAATLAMLGRMHGAGLEQRDIHPDNFLWANGTIHVIDGGGILARQRPLPEATAMENLALFLAQFPPAETAEWLPLALAHYRPEQAVDAHALSRRLDRLRDARWRSYSAKLLRDCTEVRCEKHWSAFLALRREFDDDALRGLLAEPDRHIAEAKLLKAGNSSTVALVRLPGRDLVVKRYNIKHWRHRLSRCWRPSRARHSWINAHHLRFLGIATPEPVAFLERRFGPLRGAAYYVMEHVAGDDLTARLKNRVVKSLMEPVAHLLGQLFQARLAHGDLKATNILCHAERPCLVDLDAMRWKPDERHFLKAYRQERQRFLANWPESSAIRHWFDAHLPRADAP